MRWRPAVERFWEKVDVTAGCWVWTAALNHKGYGTFRGPEGKNVRAHRFSYELEHGPLDADIELDHTCLNRACVNPDHLRPATTKQNCEHRDGGHNDSRSGRRGVSWHKKTGKWAARVCHEGRDIHIGLFADPDEAAEAARLKRLELFTFNDSDRAAA